MWHHRKLLLIQLANVKLPNVKLLNVELPNVVLSNKELPNIELPNIELPNFESYKRKLAKVELIVRYHCGGWSVDINSCILNSYMVYL